MKTYAPKRDDIERRWYVVDANGAVLGRLASEVAKILRGKHKPIFAPHADVGDHVIVVNAKGIRLTGGKEFKKMAYRHSGYPGGLTETPYDALLEKRPRFVVEKAVKGMLPKNRLGRAMFGKLQVYEGPEHPHQAQRPVPLTLGDVPKWEGRPKREPKPEAVEKPKAPARKPATRRAAAAPATKKPAAKRSTAKKSTAKRSTARPPAPEEQEAQKRPAAKRSTEKKATAKRSMTRRGRKPKKEKE
jgi:large subunit ribosomal protein L13